MESCRDLSSSLCRSGNVSWCVDSADSPASAAAPLTDTAASKDVSDRNQQSASSGSIPLLLLSPPQTGGAAANAAFSHQRPQPALSKRKHQQAVMWSRHPQSNPRSSSALHDTDKHTDEDDDNEEGSKRNLSPEEGDSQSKDNFHLPRSSPVISRRHGTVSWLGGRTDASYASGSDSAPPACASLSLDQHERPTGSRGEHLGVKAASSSPQSAPVQVDEKQCCISVSSNLNCLLSSLTGHHLHDGGRQGLAEEHGQQGLTLPAQHNKDRRRSGIPEFSADIFKTSCELEKENAHFIVVDMVLEVLEGVKWTLKFDRRASFMDAHQHAHCMTCTQRHASSAQDSVPHKQTRGAHRHAQDCSAGDPERESNKRRVSDEDMKTSHRDTHASYVRQHTQGKDEEEAGNDEAEHQAKTLSVLSTDSGFEECGLDTTLTPRDSLRNAEWLAQRLVLEFRRSWLPSNEPRRGRQSLRSSLQELPGTERVAASSGSLAEEIRLRTRMRGSLTWAPPRFQIIFSIQPTHRRSEVVASQHFLCAGCGTEVEPRYIKKLRYCEYLGRYFCDCCHSGSEAVIPGRVLSCWDFGRYSVSDFSKQLLDSVWHQPLFDLTCVGKTLYSRVKELDKFRELQEQLLAIKKLLTACRLSGRVVAELEQLPAHLMEQPHLFSMDDLLKVKKGQLVAQARAVMHSANDHIEHCELCLARGFICEFCREKDVIFPFQRDICTRCTVCKACFHKHCFVEKKCPKCARIHSRKKRPDGSAKCDA